MARLAADAALGAYRAFGFVVRPLAPLLLGWRANRGKEDRSRLGERYGVASRPRPPGRVVWVHAASVGETNTVLPLIRRIVDGGASVVLTTVTVTGAKVAAEKLPPGAVHQYSPADVGSWIRAFAAHWQPECAIFVESEIWPATFATLSDLDIPRVVVNGRLSPKSFEGWKRHPSIAAALFSRISLCLAQSERDGVRYRALGAPSVVVTGNLKFDTPPPVAAPAELAKLAAAVGRRPVWAAASTHPGEDEAIADAHRLMAKARPGLLTMIAPRHPVRGPAIRAMLAGRGFAVAQRSVGDPLTAETEIYVADTLGELGLLYSLAPVAFVGGSLVEHGGQNPIEPLRLGTAILHGPHVHNFPDVYAAIDGAVPSGRVADADSLAGAAGRLLDDPRAREQAAAAALAALGPFAGALDRTMEALRPHLERRGRPAGRVAFREAVSS